MLTLVLHDSVKYFTFTEVEPGQVQILMIKHTMHPETKTMTELQVTRYVIQVLKTF
jgi:hypothetical protein